MFRPFLVAVLLSSSVLLPALSLFPGSWIQPGGEQGVSDLDASADDRLGGVVAKLGSEMDPFGRD